MKRRLKYLLWRSTRLAQRYGLAWRYATGRMSEDDADGLRYECQHLSGFYPLSVFTREAVLRECRERWGDAPELPGLVEAACRRVAGKWSGDGEDGGAAESWAMELVAEYAAADGVVLTDLWNEPEDEA